MFLFASQPAIQSQFGIPAFPSLWVLSKGLVTGEQEAGTNVVRLNGGSGCKIQVTIPHPLADRRIAFSIWLKGSDDNQWVSVNTFATKQKDGRSTPAQLRVNLEEGYRTTEYAVLDKTWKKFTKSLTISRSAQQLSIVVSDPWKQPLFVAAPKFELKDKELCDLDGPGVLEAAESVWVRPKAGCKIGHVTFPVPIVYRSQAPLAIKITSNRPGTVKGYRFFRRPDGVNWLCDVAVQVHASTQIGWQALVLARPQPELKLAPAKDPSQPEGAVPWLRSTACVEMDAKDIVAEARKLDADKPDIETYVRRVISFTCDNRGGDGPWNALDAVTAMHCAGGGSCTNRANLAAALLRLHGIPARTVAHLPTWCYGEPLFTHWLVEYWHPGAGWTSVESTWGEFEPPAYTTVLVAISSPSDEDRSFDKVQARWVLPGAPMWSVPCVHTDLVPDPGADQQSNWARPSLRLPLKGFQSLFVRASSLYPRLMRSGRIADPKYYARIARALRSGRARDIERILTRPGHMPPI